MDNNTDDAADNNTRLLRELKDVPSDKRSGRFVCVYLPPLAMDKHWKYGRMKARFKSNLPRGTNGFGYDPLFSFHGFEKAFAESTQKKTGEYGPSSGAAFRQFLAWSAHEKRHYDLKLCRRFYVMLP